jgi:hypothetical protein
LNTARTFDADAARVTLRSKPLQLDLFAASVVRILDDGAPIARVPAGAASTHVGQELDAQVSRALTPQLQLAAGIGHIFPGGFLDEATPGASYTAPFVMFTSVLIADK